jgi:hypothetical protein
MPIITRDPRFISVISCVLAAVVAAIFAGPCYADWKVDFSRREQQGRTQELREPASSDAPVLLEPPKTGFFESLFESGEINGEIVVLNTDKGFVPSTIRVKKGFAYQIHVVNVNEKEKNVSFVLDSFSEHHATFYGKIKTFVIRPQKEGVFRFVSPETSAQGKLVVSPGTPDARQPASDE